MIAGCVIALALGVLAPPPEAAPPPAPPAESPRRDEEPPLPLAVRFADRLTLLDPINPGGYLLLGEEAAALAASPEDVRLARELLVLACVIDREKTGGRLHAASAILALTEVAPLDSDRRWLTALARRVDPRITPPAWLERGGSDGFDDQRYEAATALGLVRSGDGIPARELLADPAVVRLLEQSLAGSPGGWRDVLRESRRWPCAECRNARVVKRPVGGQARVSLCGTCRGNPGPVLSDAALLAQLRAESWLLDAPGRTWAARFAADDGSPLRDPDLDELAPSFGVDASLRRWRDGRWVAEPAAITEPASPATPEPGPAERPSAQDPAGGSPAPE